MSNKLPKTREAIVAYYNDIPRRDALWVCANDEAALLAARDADDTALMALRTVFAEETADYNDHSVAMSATTGEIRLAVGFSDDEANAVLKAAFQREVMQFKPVLKDGELENFILKIGGVGYQCACKCNVFHKPDNTKLNLYECNSCGTRFKTH